MSSVTEKSAQLSSTTVTVTIPAGIPGVNAFSTEQWWADRSQELSDSRILTIDAPGSATVLELRAESGDSYGVRQTSTPGRSVVLMIIRPLRDWLLDADSADPIDRLRRWGDDVVSWLSSAPVELVVSSQEPRTLDQLMSLATGQRGPDASTGSDRSETASAFASTLQSRLERREAGMTELDRPRSQAAIDAMTAGTGGRATSDTNKLQAAARDVRDRLVGAGVRLRGPRTALDWPAPPAVGGGVPLPVAAEASLAILLAELEPSARPAAAAAGEWWRLTAQRSSLRAQLQQARKQLISRRKRPDNLRRLPVRAIFAQLLLGRQVRGHNDG